MIFIHFITADKAADWSYVSFLSFIVLDKYFALHTAVSKYILETDHF